MKDMEGQIDRRTFVKSTLAAGALVALGSSVEEPAWAQSSSTPELADLPLTELSKMIRDGQITSRRLVDLRSALLVVQD
ncbi:MAG: twin-arginine translocation signal domain-containing protein [Thermodesulfobacteriota bacterium]